MSTLSVDSFSSAAPANYSESSVQLIKADFEAVTSKSKSANDSFDQVDVGMDQVYKSLTVLADQVLQKLQEILGDSLPEGGVYGLKPEDHTSEKTAQRIVDGVTALFGVFSRQNKDLEGEELISKFMETIRGGISQGYSEADAILGDIGAYDIGGVKDGIEETKRLVEEKLQAFEKQYRESQGLTNKADEPQQADS